MSQTFDPYLQWLGIRDTQRPPNHYRLLGLELFESNETVIANAADRQMAHIRTFQTGAHADLSQQLLNELAAARVCLLKADKKAAYDKQLRAKTAAERPAATATPKPAPAGKPATPRPAPAAANKAPRTAAVKPVQPTGPAQPAAAVATDSPFAEIASAAASNRTSRHKRKQKKSPAPYALAAIVILAAATIALMAMRPDQPPHVATGTPAKQPIDKPEATAPPAKPDTPRVDSPDSPSPGEPPKETSPKPELVTPEIHVPVVKEPERPTGEAESQTPSPEAGPSGSSQPDSPDQPADEGNPTEEPSLTEEPSPEPPDEEAEPAEEPTEGPEHPAPPREPADKRLPIPDKDAQAQALKQIRDLYSSQFTARKPAERAAFAQKLLAVGKETTGDGTSAYVLYEQALAIAAGAGEVKTALTAADQMASRYQCEGMEVKVEALKTLARNLATPESIREMAQACGQLTTEAVEQDRYDLAKQFNSLALAAARRTKEAALISQADNSKRDLRAYERAYERVKPSLDTIKTSATDSEANLIVGQFYCFVKGDFSRGLRYLLKGSDKDLQELARLEMVPDPTPDKQHDLANRWWARAEKETGETAKAIRSHAARLYAVALPSLQGLQKSIATERLKQAAGEGAESGNGLRNANPVAILTKHAWRFVFTKTDGTQQQTVYPRVTFSLDGTCESSLVGKGVWYMDGDWVAIKYAGYPDMVQRIRPSAGEFTGQCFNPMPTLASTIAATRLD